MVQLILIRPGSTEYDQQSRIQGRLDIPLCDAGRQEALSAADGMRPYLPKALYHAPCTSAQETAEILGDVLKLKPKELDDLKNLDQGLWQGMLVDEIRHKQPKVFKQWQEHPETVCPPQGESLAEVTERAEDVLEKLARKHRNGTIVLVAPEPLASVVRARLEGTDLGDLWHAANGCRHVEVLHLQRNLATVATCGTNSSHALELMPAADRAAMISRN
jgi:probable phosphoglycerate mutase